MCQRTRLTSPCKEVILNQLLSILRMIIWTPRLIWMSQLLEHMKRLNEKARKLMLECQRACSGIATCSSLAIGTNLINSMKRAMSSNENHDTNRSGYHPIDMKLAIRNFSKSTLSLRSEDTYIVLHDSVLGKQMIEEE